VKHIIVCSDGTGNTAIKDRGTNVFKIFELVYMLTGGGPVHASETLVSYMYFVTFTNQQYGYGMALAVIITILGAVVSVGYLALARGRKQPA